MYGLAVSSTSFWKVKLEYVVGDSKFSLKKEKDGHIERNLQRMCLEKGRETKQRLNKNTHTRNRGKYKLKIFLGSMLSGKLSDPKKKSKFLKSFFLLGCPAHASSNVSMTPDSHRQPPLTCTYTHNKHPDEPREKTQKKTQKL